MAIKSLVGGAGKPDITTSGAPTSGSGIRIREDDGSLTQVSTIAPIQSNSPTPETSSADDVSFYDDTSNVLIDELAADNAIEPELAFLQDAEQDFFGAGFDDGRQNRASTPAQVFAAEPRGIDGEALGIAEVDSLIAEEAARGRRNRASDIDALVNTQSSNGAVNNAIDKLQDTPTEIPSPNHYSGLQYAVADTVQNIAQDPTPVSNFTKSALNKLGVLDGDGQINPQGIQALTYGIASTAVAHIDNNARQAEVDFNVKDADVADLEAELSDDSSTSFTTFETPKAIVRKVKELLSQAPQDGEAVSPDLFTASNLTDKEAQAAIGFVMRGLQKREYLTNISKNAQEPEYVAASRLNSALETQPDLVAYIRKSQEKDVSSVPAPSGLVVSEAAALFQARGKTQSKQKLSDINMVVKALDYFGTNPNTPAISVWAASTGMLQQIMVPNSSNLSIVKQGQDGKLRLSEPFGPDFGPIPISDHPLASKFQMDIQSFISIMNSAFNDGSKLISTREDVRDLIQKASERGPSGARVNEETFKLVLEAIQIHKDLVYNRVSANYETARQLGKVFYFPMELIGINGRMRVASSAMNFQNNPAYRGMIRSVNPPLVSADRGSPANITTRAMIARIFDLDAANGQSAEHTPARQARANIFDYWFNYDKNQRHTATNPPKFKGPNEHIARNWWQAYQTLQAIMPKSLNDAIDVGKLTAEAYTKGKENIAVKRSDNWAGGVAGAAYLNININQNGSPSPAALKQLSEVLGWTLPEAKVETTGRNKVDSTGKDKEADMKVAALLAWGKIIEGNDFVSELTAELDGINNNFGFLALLLGDPWMAKHAGLLNPDLVEQGKFLSEGDVRDAIASNAPDIIATLYPDETHRAEREMADTIQQVLSENYKASKAWKKTAMVFGYGKLDYLHEDFAASISELPGFKEKLTIALDNKYSVEDAVRVFSAAAPFVMIASLGPAVQLAQTQQRVGQLASELNVSATWINPLGLEVNLSSIGYELTEHRTTIFANPKDDITSSIHTQESRSTTDARKRKPKTKEGETKDNATGAFIQKGRLSPVYVHNLDASVMALVAIDVANANKGKSNQEKIWFNQAFDAVFVDARSYEFVQDSYNRNMVKLVKDLNPYVDLKKIVERIEDDAVRDGDPAVADDIVKTLLDQDAKFLGRVGLTPQQLNEFSNMVEDKLVLQEKLLRDADSKGRAADLDFIKTGDQDLSSKIYATAKAEAFAAGKIPAGAMRKLVEAYTQVVYFKEKQPAYQSIDSVLSTGEFPTPKVKLVNLKGSIKNGAKQVYEAKSSLKEHLKNQDERVKEAQANGNYNLPSYPAGNMQ